MDYRFYESKIIYILIITLALIQLGAFFILSSGNQKIAEDTIRDELLVGAQVFKRLLESRHRQLKQAGNMLASDYGFRESIATQDRSTIESMLMNHSKRAEAAALVLSSLDEELLASVPSTLQIATEDAPATSSNQTTNPFIFQLAKLKPASEGSADEALLFQFVSIYVKAPLPIAKLTIGYAIDDQFAQDLREVTDMEFFFLSGTDLGWRLHASTLPSQIISQFFASFNHSDGETKLVELDDNAYLMMPILLGSSDQERILAVIAKPLKTVMQPFERIESRLFYLLIATILLSMIVIYLVGHKMVRPLNNYAHMDNLTGLGNRRLFNVLMERSLADLQVFKKPFALLFMDLNKFKQINDIEGHDAGDVVLALTAGRIREVMRNSDNIIRLGGDEFALLVPGGTRDSAQMIADKINQATSLPIPINGKFIEVGISIGIALAPEDGIHQSILVRKADLAMYAAKTQQSGYSFYHEPDEQVK
jgi:diguanylate cyclase (GGDEF)-like protein